MLPITLGLSLPRVHLPPRPAAQFALLLQVPLIPQLTTRTTHPLPATPMFRSSSHTLKRKTVPAHPSCPIQETSPCTQEWCARGTSLGWGLLMVRSSPPNAGGIGGRGRIATIGDINCWNQFNKNYQNNTTTLPTSNTRSTLTNMGILDGTRLAAAACPQENNNHTFETEIAQTTHDGTNVLAIDTSNTCSNTSPSLQINRTLGNSPKVCRGTTNSRASNFSNTVSMNSEDTRPRHNGSPPPPCPRQLHGSKRSRWSESKAVCCFNAQSRQFDQGQWQFISHQLPTTQDIVALAAQRTRHRSR